ncbi:MAG TPA: sigma-70 family RNA polymerase sigma factor [Actinomycetota bacterium]|jgi:RNA polymerase sigma-70 factor (ECF subfamily)
MDGAGEGRPDAELVRRAQQSDDAAFAQLVRRHEQRVYALAYRMLGRAEDARDAAQEAFTSAYRRLDSFRGDAAFTTWLHRITVNACYDQLRRRKGEPDSIEELPAPYEPAAGDDPADAAAAAVDVQRALLAIPAEFRSVVILHDAQQLAYEEIAEILGVPVGTVKSRLHRGRIALGRLLSEPAGEREPKDPSSPSKPENPT